MLTRLMTAPAFAQMLERLLSNGARTILVAQPPHLLVQ
jgi:hypothetical protein